MLHKQKTKECKYLSAKPFNHFKTFQAFPSLTGVFYFTHCLLTYSQQAYLISIQTTDLFFLSPGFYFLELFNLLPFLLLHPDSLLDRFSSSFPTCRFLSDKAKITDSSSVTTEMRHMIIHQSFNNPV